MDLLENLERRIARAKRDGRENLVEMLEARYNQLKNPQSAQTQFVSSPLVSRKTRQ